MIISIAIPTYEMPPNGADYLDYSLFRIFNQTYSKKLIEVVISDHCEDDTIKSVVDKWSKHINIVYIRKDYNRDNPSDNLNVAIAACSGSYIKILFQDDFLYADNAIEKLVESINNNIESEWFVSACQHYDGESFYRELQPSLNNPKSLIDGNNTIGSPSVMCFKNRSDNLLFDLDHSWLMDVKFYYLMYEKYGLPVFIATPLVAIRTGAHQLTETLTNDQKEKEHLLLKQQYSGL